MNEIFRRFATKASLLMGTPMAFILAMLVLVMWAFTGPLFDYSDTWQLIINTGTTIVTFLMVFLIQNTQNRETKALHLKLDELIRTNHEARNGLLNIENLSDEELDLLQMQFEKLRERHDSLEEDVTELVEVVNSSKNENP